MADRIDQEGRASFVQTLPRKVTELRATLGTLVADPRSGRMRDELRRRLHALYTLTRSYSLATLSEGLREGIAHLDAIRGAGELSQRDLETLADLIGTLPSLAQRDLPEAHDLFARPATSASSAQLIVPAPRPTQPPPARAPSSAPSRGGSIQQPPEDIAPTRPTFAGMPAVTQPDAIERPSLPPRASIPLGVLIVGSAGLALEARRVLPAEAEVTGVRTLSEAVSAARDTAPDVIVAEVAQPADGLGLLAALRGDPLTDFLPVVLLASSHDKLDGETARAQGATELLSVPIEPETLRTVIDRVVRGALQPSIAPAPAFGELTLEELTRTLQEEIRRGILGAAGPHGASTKIPLGQGSEVLAATWEAIARVREVVEKRSHGKVRFQVPAAPLGLGSAHVVSIGDGEQAPPEETVEGEDPLAGRRALVVDDDPGVVWFFAGLLREAGMEVVECHDGLEALREARRGHPDVIISDILMPGLDGFALCRAIRRDVALRHTPMILLSWKDDLLVRMRELGAQAQGFLRKESRGDAILQRVRAVLRPRVRLLRRLDALAEGAELRGRIERIGVISLIEGAARALADATLTITDSFSVTEIELREGKLASVVRTAQDGSLARGEGALLQALGATSARFVLKRASHPVRSNVQGDLGKLLAGGAALISAIEDSVSGAALMEVASIDLDVDGALSYARSLPRAMRTLVERIVRGESPRGLVLNQGVAPLELEPVLVELARRGAIRNVRGPNGEDLVAPRFAAAHVDGASLPPGFASQAPAAIDGALDAVRVPPAPAMPSGLFGLSTELTTSSAEAEPVDLIVQRLSAPPESPPSDPPPDLASLMHEASVVPPEPAISSVRPTLEEGPRRTRSGPVWTPPTTIDEAAQPGFGVDGKDSLADAVLREITEPDDARETPVQSAPPAVVIAATPVADASPAVAPAAAEGEAEDDDSGPEFEANDEEHSLTPEELRAAAESAPGLPLEGVELDARGLPRRRHVSDLPPIGGPLFEPHEPTPRPEPPRGPSSSIIVDEAAVGGPVLTLEPPETPPEKKGGPSRAAPSRRPSHRPQDDTATFSNPGTPGAKAGGAASSARVVAPTQPPRRSVVWLLLAILGLGALSYFGMRALLQAMQPDAAAGNGAVVPDAGAAPAEAAADASAATDARQVAPGEAVAASDAQTDAPAAPSNASAAQVTYEDAARYLDGGTLDTAHGVLVVDAPHDVDVALDLVPFASLPATQVVTAGPHSLRFRRGDATGYAIVNVEPGRAARIDQLPRSVRGEP